MKRALVFIFAFSIVFVTLAYIDSNKSIYDYWYSFGSKKSEFLNDEVYVTHKIISEVDNEDVLLFYSDDKRAIYCTEGNKEKNIKICVPAMLNDNDVNLEEYLSNLIKKAEQEDLFLAKISTYNLALLKIMNINTAKMDISCFSEKSCPFNRYLSYRTSTSNIFRNLLTADEDKIK